ncbi:hypothetical protein [Kitasatospora sp. GP82]|uniref:hypothetical protein n=1 Tax=Kitasatospora sp. GP82 TaxID=3035089 RepID=UPI00247B9EA9|nr:hypothetical protein [Kitasatospora sp. GP82]
MLSTLANSRTHHLLTTGQNTPSALTNGIHLAFGVATALIAIAFVLTVAVLRQPQAPSRSAVRTAPAAG